MSSDFYHQKIVGDRRPEPNLYMGGNAACPMGISAYSDYVRLRLKK